MIRNYLNITLRYLQKNKLYFLIIFSGLILGYTSCLLIYLHVSQEFSYDRYHPDAERIYRVVKDFANDGGTYLPDATTPPALAPAIAREIPEVEAVVRLFPSWGNQYLFKKGEQSFYEEGVYRADASIFDIFTFRFLAGNPETALQAPESLVITAAMARKYFGESWKKGEDILGQTLEVMAGTQSTLCQITGVIEVIPSQSHFHFDFLRPMITDIDQDWDWYNWYTYIKVKPQTNFATVEDKIIALYQKHNPESKNRYYIQALQDIHLHSQLKWELEPNGHIAFVNIFIIISIFIMLMASCNYINLSILQAFQRSKEVGIRKASGAQRKGLIGQFILESIALNLLAIILSIGLAELSIPYLNALFALELQPFSQQPWVKILLVVLGAGVIGLMAGFYPAWYLSAFQPVKVLKGIFRPDNHNQWLRKGLVVLQFTISVALIAGAIIVSEQVRFLKLKDLGFDPQQIIIIENAGYVNNKEAMKQALRQVPSVEKLGSANTSLGGLNWTSSMAAKGNTQESLINFSIIDDSYLEVMDMQWVAGRNFSPAFPSDTVEAVILNETAVKDLGIQSDPVGALITDRPDSDTIPYYKVIGVIKDFHFASLHSEIKPFAFFLNDRNINNFVVKINSTDFSATLQQLNRAWASVAPDQPFEYSFLDENLQALYQAEQNFKRVFAALTFLAIYIACAGLFAVASFFIKRRTKEIGIRKALGASLGQLLVILSKDYIRLIVIAFLVAIPIANYFMREWLQSFAYHIQLHWWMFALPGFLVLFIALLSLSGHIVKAARRNPVESLRYE